MDFENRIYQRRDNARKARVRAQAEFDLADAWIGLDSLLKGAWGTENLNALGGGKAQIVKAHHLLGEALHGEVKPDA